MPRQLAIRPTPTLAALTAAPTATAVALAATAPAATPTPLAATQDAFVPLLPPDASPCGLTLPLFNEAAPALSTLPARSLPPSAPEDVQPVLRYIQDHPGRVGLAAYRLGEANRGVFHNAERPMPLASVVKVLHLAAFAEAVAAGELNPLEPIPVADLERYYLPGTDRGSHNTGLRNLGLEGRRLSDPDRVTLEDVARMMIRESSNSATDYLHLRLGQSRLEATAVALGLGSQTAPCPFLGQFLLAANHRQPGGAAGGVGRYHAAPEVFGRDVMALTYLFSEDDAFRAPEIAWRNQGGRAPLITQERFAAGLNARASAADYAALMARLAQNGLNSAEASFLARRQLEWPMRFEANQEIFSNLGYKNGRLPGIITLVYYAYRQGDNLPVVVALFFDELPAAQQRAWQRTLAHDAFARWLLADPAAIGVVRDFLAP